MTLLAAHQHPRVHHHNRRTGRRICRRTTLSLHHYRLQHAMDGEHTLGSEADLQFQVETPRGAKWELAAGWFFHGSALKRLFRDEPWTLSASVSINID